MKKFIFFTLLIFCSVPHAHDTQECVECHTEQGLHGEKKLPFRINKFYIGDGNSSFEYSRNNGGGYRIWDNLWTPSVPQIDGGVQGNSNINIRYRK